MRSNVFSKTLFLGLFVLTLVGCYSGNGIVPDAAVSNDDGVHNIDETYILDVNTDLDEELVSGAYNDVNNSKLGSDTAYFEAVAAYKRVLLGEQLVIDVGTSVEIKLNGWMETTFTLYDFTRDGIPELIINLATYSYPAEDTEDGWWGVVSGGVLTYRDGEVISLYQVQSNGMIEILDNGMILDYRRSNDNMQMYYSYIQLDYEGNVICEFHCRMIIDLAEHLDLYGESEFLFSLNGEFVSHEEFEEVAAPYFTIGYGLVGWTDFETWANGMMNGSRIIY